MVIAQQSYNIVHGFKQFYAHCREPLARPPPTEPGQKNVPTDSEKKRGVYYYCYGTKPDMSDVPEDWKEVKKDKMLQRWVSDSP